MAKLALQAEGMELQLLAAVEGEGEEEEDGDGGADGAQGGGAGEAAARPAVSSEPTMMSQEARSLFLNGDKDSGLAAWKVGLRVAAGGAGQRQRARQGARMARALLPQSSLLPSLHIPHGRLRCARTTLHPSGPLLP